MPSQSYFPDPARDAVPRVERLRAPPPSQGRSVVPVNRAGGIGFHALPLWAEWVVLAWVWAVDRIR